MTNPLPGVKHRRKALGEVFERLDHPISILRPVKNHGQYIVDAVVDANDASNDQKRLVNLSRIRK